MIRRRSARRGSDRLDNLSSGPVVSCGHGVCTPSRHSDDVRSTRLRHRRPRGGSPSWRCRLRGTPDPRRGVAAAAMIGRLRYRKAVCGQRQDLAGSAHSRYVPAADLRLDASISERQLKVALMWTWSRPQADLHRALENLGSACLRVAGFRRRVSISLWLGPAKCRHW